MCAVIASCHKMAGNKTFQQIFEMQHEPSCSIDRIGNDVERKIISIVLRGSKAKFSHSLRFVCKRWKTYIEELGSCYYCKDNCRISIEYTLKDLRVYGETAELSDFSGRVWLGSSQNSVSKWRRQYQDYMEEHLPTVATGNCMLSEEDKALMKNAVRMTYISF